MSFLKIDTKTAILENEISISHSLKCPLKLDTKVEPMTARICQMRHKKLNEK